MFQSINRCTMTMFLSAIYIKHIGQVNKNSEERTKKCSANTYTVASVCIEWTACRQAEFPIAINVSHPLALTFNHLLNVCQLPEMTHVTNAIHIHHWKLQFYIVKLNVLLQIRRIEKDKRLPVNKHTHAHTYHYVWLLLHSANRNTIDIW